MFEYSLWPLLRRLYKTACSVQSISQKCALPHTNTGAMLLISLVMLQIFQALIIFRARLGLSWLQPVTFEWSIRRMGRHVLAEMRHALLVRAADGAYMFRPVGLCATLRCFIKADLLVTTVSQPGHVHGTVCRCILLTCIFKSAFIENDLSQPASSQGNSLIRSWTFRWWTCNIWSLIARTPHFGTGHGHGLFFRWTALMWARSPRR